MIKDRYSRQYFDGNCYHYLSLFLVKMGLAIV